MRSHQGEVWRYLRLLGCTPELAEDLVQETFLVVLKKPFEQRSPAQTASYLRRIARYLHLDRCRRRKRAESWAAAVDAISDRGALEDDVAQQRLDGLQHCLRELEGRPLEAIELFYRQRLSRAEVALRMGMKETGVKTLLQRVRAHLRQCIERRLGS